MNTKGRSIYKVVNCLEKFLRGFIWDGNALNRFSLGCLEMNFFTTMYGKIGVGSLYQKSNLSLWNDFGDISNRKILCREVSFVIFMEWSIGVWKQKAQKKGRQRVWSNIMKNREHFFSFVEFVVGNERRIKLWEDILMEELQENLYGYLFNWFFVFCFWRRKRSLLLNSWSETKLII